MSWPTTDDPRTEFVTMRLTVSEMADLDAYAKSKGYTRSAALRDCTDRVLTAEKRREARTKKVSP